MTMGRKPEDIRYSGPAPPAAGAPPIVPVAGDNFRRPTDVAWDARETFSSPMDMRIRAWRNLIRMEFTLSPGAVREPQGQFHTFHTIAMDAKDNIYVGDRGKRRIQVFDDDGTFKTEYLNGGDPRAICVSRASTNICIARTPTAFIDGRRRNIQNGTRRQDRRKIRQCGQAPERFRYRQSS